MSEKIIITAFVALACAAGFAQSKAVSGRDSFMQQQAFSEMQRVSGQVDMLQSNLNELQTRVGRLEGSGDTKNIRQEIEALKAAVADIRREMQSQREEIVRDLSVRIAKMQQVQAPAQRPAPQPAAVSGPHIEYVVQSGDTLSMIAAAFYTSVAKIKEMNGLKNDNLRVGQKLIVPKK